MHAKHHVNFRIFQNSIGYHQRGTAMRSRFFRRLEHQLDGTSPGVAVFYQRRCGPQQHGHMTVMSAGVHDPFIAGTIGNAVSFRDRQSIHVGAQRYNAARSFSFNRGQYSCVSVKNFRRNIERLKLPQNEVPGLVLTAANFGIGMQFASPLNHLPEFFG